MVHIITILIQTPIIFLWYYSLVISYHINFARKQKKICIVALYSINAILDWNTQTCLLHDLTDSLTEYFWEFQNNALWDTLQQALSVTTLLLRVGAVKRILRRELQAMNCSSTRSYSSVTWPVKNGLLTTSNRQRKRPLSDDDDKITHDKTQDR